MNDDKPEHPHDRLARHFVGAVIVLGLYGTINIVLLGFVDIANPTVALLVGQVVGVIGTLAGLIASGYFPNAKFNDLRVKPEQP